MQLRNWDFGRTGVDTSTIATTSIVQKAVMAQQLAPQWRLAHSCYLIGISTRFLCFQSCSSISIACGGEENI